MTDYQAYGENTWEFAAWKAIREHDLDVPANRTETFSALYDSDQFAMVAAKAWNELADWSITDMVGLMARKQHDYGHANVLKFGAHGVKVRLWDKISRYENLLSRIGGEKEDDDKVALNESITDTLIDIVGYVTILFMVQRGTFSNQLAQTDEDKGIS